MPKSQPTPKAAKIKRDQIIYLWSHSQVCKTKIKITSRLKCNRNKLSSTSTNKARWFLAQVIDSNKQFNSRCSISSLEDRQARANKLRFKTNNKLEDSQEPEEMRVAMQQICQVDLGHWQRALTASTCTQVWVEPFLREQTERCLEYQHKRVALRPYTRPTHSTNMVEETLTLII